MAVLNKLRNSTWVLILVLVSLVLFVVSDYFSSNSRFGFGGDQNVGEIAGTEISLIEYDAKYKELLAQLEAGGTPESEASREQASTFAWNQFIQSLIIDKEFAKLGLDVSVEESGKLLYSDDAHPTIKQYFSRDGQFSPSYVLNFKNQVAKKDPKMMAQFELIIKQIVMEVQSRKYNSMVAKSLYATDLDAEDDFFASSSGISGKSISLNFASIEDKTIKVEDSELKEYISKHKEDFQQKAARDLEYILVNISPSREDTLAIKEDLEADIANFASAEDDSAYTALNSTVAFTGEFKARGSYEKNIENRLFSAPKDSVVGPLYYNGGYSLFKIVDRKNDSAVYYHIVKAELPIMGTTRQDTLDVLAKGKKLGIESNSASDALAFFNSKSSSGEVTYAQDLGWQRMGSQDPEIEKAVKSLSAGQSTAIKTIYGISVIKMVDAKTSEMLKVAEVRKPVEALKSTEDEAFQKISNFRSALTGKDKGEFEALCKKNGFPKSVASNLKESDKTMTGIPGTAEVIRWAFSEERELGDYSDVISAGDLLIVAHLVKMKKEGTADLEDVREQVYKLVLNQKKADILKKQLEDAIQKSKTMEEIALAVKSVVQPFYNVNFYANSVQFTGNDPKLVGYVCGMKAKKVSKPVISDEGVHVFFVESIEKPEVPKDLKARKGMIFDQKKQQAYNSVFEALKKAADVKDERYKFY